MLHAQAFDRIGVVIGDLYFATSRSAADQEVPERGVRLELRFVERDTLQGNEFSAQPITFGKPIWRVDLLESARGPIETFDRTHHHPKFNGWNPVGRCFVEELSADPLGWL